MYLHMYSSDTIGFMIYNLQEVAIKRMTATKTKEFLAEMKVLCKVHHTNLVILSLNNDFHGFRMLEIFQIVNFYRALYIQVELIGYAATDDELFLIYEYAQKGSLRNHLHDPQSKGKIHITTLWDHVFLSLLIFFIFSFCCKNLFANSSWKLESS